MEAAAGAATIVGGTPGAPAGLPASGDAGGATSSTSANDNEPPVIHINGSNPAQWPLNQIWNDNLGALFTHDGIAETIYSTSTVDTTISGATTLDYWAVIPSSQQVLHATRDVVIAGAANDNPPHANTTTPPATNDNPPPLEPTGTDASPTLLQQ